MSGVGIRVRGCRFTGSAEGYSFKRKNLSGGQMRIYKLHNLGADGNLLDAKFGRGNSVRTPPAPFSCESFISVP